MVAAQRQQGTQPDGEAERERQPPDQQVDERADPEPPRCDPPPRQPDQQLVERPARHERGGDSGDPDAEHGRDGGEEHSVARHVVAREPLQVEHLAEAFGERVWYTWAG